MSVEKAIHGLFHLDRRTVRREHVAEPARCERPFYSHSAVPKPRVLASPDTARLVASQSPSIAKARLNTVLCGGSLRAAWGWEQASGAHNAAQQTNTCQMKSRETFRKPYPSTNVFGKAINGRSEQSPPSVSRPALVASSSSAAPSSGRHWGTS